MEVGAMEGDTMKYRVAALLRLLDYAKYLLKGKTKYICLLGVSGCTYHRVDEVTDEHKYELSLTWQLNFPFTGPEIITSDRLRETG